MRPRVAVPLAVVAAGVAGVGYAWGYELRAFRLRHVDVPVLPAGAAPLRILHVSDIHMAPGQQWKVDWIRALGDLDPHLVVDTGDNLGSPHGVEPLLDALAPLLRVPGVFVPGSNDFHAPRPKNPARYLLPDSGRRVRGRPLPWPQVRDAFSDAGWLDLTHRRTTLSLAGLTVEVAGVNDPHLKADHYDRVAGPVPPGADVGLGLLHSPEPRVLRRFAGDGFALTFSGHTHGGQLRVPGFGALVTNCGLDPKRARGLSRWDDGRMWMHVSAGLGTSPYAPVRFACPPEATLLTLVPGPR
jgi:predicted MPP superfamily phosphohydrolase